MAYYNKIGLLILNETADKFLVCEPGDKYEEKKVTQYLMPGGQLEEDSDEECLVREIKEELDCEVDRKSLQYIAAYTAEAAYPGREVMIRLYQGKVIGQAKPSAEIGALHWIGREDANNDKVSPIIKKFIIPDLVNKKILK